MLAQVTENHPRLRRRNIPKPSVTVCHLATNGRTTDYRVALIVVSKSRVAAAYLYSVQTGQRVKRCLQMVTNRRFGDANILLNNNLH